MKAFGSLSLLSRKLVFLLLMIALMGISPVIYLHNPAHSHFYPICLFHQLTGVNCPGCGGFRAVYQLLHGHFLLALRDNALSVIVLPILMIYYCLWTFLPDLLDLILSRMPIIVRVRCSAFLFWAVLTFWIVRNIPIYPFVLLSPMK